MGFRKIQELGNVRAEDYLVTVGRREILKDLAMQGDCGKPICLPHDDRFIIKTLRKSEAKLLIEILPSYYDHIKKHDKCLLGKYYALHVTTPLGIAGPKVYFVVMENLLQANLHMHKKYDLKGSTQGRGSAKSVNPSKMKLKNLDLDLDFNLRFVLHQSTRNQHLQQLKLDCEFLQKHDIMGYSLLLGVHIEALPEGYVAVLGKPNIGESTLSNQMVGHKLSIVTDKPQTTRHRILGICSAPDYQV